MTQIVPTVGSAKLGERGNGEGPPHLRGPFHVPLGQRLNGNWPKTNVNFLEMFKGHQQVPIVQYTQQSLAIET